MLHIKGGIIDRVEGDGAGYAIGGRLDDADKGRCIKGYTKR